MLLDPQALAGLIAAVLFALSGKVYQLSTRQGRALRKANRGAEYLEDYIAKLRRVIRQNDLEVPPYPKELNYLNPSTEEGAKETDG